jgi:3-isopropylmalate/(R)-2-methylmalate dehydratase small subunit
MTCAIRPTARRGRSSSPTCQPSPAPASWWPSATSSRENAVTVMVDNGLRAFIAPSFGDIFFNNCFQNGALPIRLDAGRAAEIRAALHAKPGARISIDLANQTVVGPDGKTDRFEIDSFRKECLLKGVDEVNLTLGYEKDIAAFEAKQRQEMSWL